MAAAHAMMAMGAATLALMAMRIGTTAFAMMAMGCPRRDVNRHDLLVLKRQINDVRMMAAG